jgi:acetyltransferase
VDARLTVAYQSPGARRYAHMAIHPYPGHLVRKSQLADGTDIVIRPIRPEDARIEQEFVRHLSPQSKYFRFMRTLQELTPEMLVRFTQIDYDQEMALIAVVQENAAEIEVGVARYAMEPDGMACEFAIVVADEWRHRGIGFKLMTQLMEIARARDLKNMEGEVLQANTEMQALAVKLGFSVSTSTQDRGVMYLSRRL